MRICFLTNRPLAEVPAARVDRVALERAGHSVVEARVVSPGSAMPADGSIGVPSRIPRGMGAPGAALRRLQPEGWRRRSLERRMARAAAGTGATLFRPVTSGLVGAAATAAGAVGGAVMRTPAQPDAGDVDLIRLGPHRSDLTAPAPPRRPYRPAPGRHAGRTVVLAYRRTDTNPGKYLEEGLRRSGADLRVEAGRLDFSTLDPATDLVLLVEGPYPALEVTGPTPDVPILYWAHHGEHHLHANLRLADRYRADAVLLAHSWHLAPWFPAPVHRFPFGMATELLDPSKPLAERRFDVAMVGAKLWEGGPYHRRQSLVAALAEAIPEERLGFGERVSAEEMARLYGDARIIANEGGIRHFPITMRVLEAVGSRALLLTDDLPGTDLILERGAHYQVLAEDVVAQVKALLAQPERMQEMVDAAYQHASALHTCDHRVDELFEIAASTPKRQIPPAPLLDPLAALVDGDPEVQRVAQVGAPELAGQLTSRQVLDAADIDPARLAPGKMETVAVRAEDLRPHFDVLRSARRYLYLDGAAHGLAEFLATEHPQALVEGRGELTRVDLMAESYRVLPHELIGP